MMMRDEEKEKLEWYLDSYFIILLTTVSAKGIGLFLVWQIELEEIRY